MTKLTPITIEATVRAPVDAVWKCWTEPDHITKWNNASDDWHSPRATNDLRVGGKFSARMESKNGKEGFDFEGTYTEVVPNKRISYKMDDGRKVTVIFAEKGNNTHVTETFDPETTNPPEMQRGGWQAILDNFRKHTESLSFRD